MAQLDKVMTDKYGVEKFGIQFNGNVRWFIARQHNFCYPKKCWINPTKSKYASDQLYFEYSSN